jgi:hypothetical protein
MDTRISDTRRWRSQRLSTAGVSKCRNAKSQKPEIGASLEVMDTGISDTGRWRSQRLSTSRVSKCQKAKRRNYRSRHIISGFQLPGDGEVIYSHHKESRSVEMRNPETYTSTNHISKPRQLRTHGTIRQ